MTLFPSCVLIVTFGPSRPVIRPLTIVSPIHLRDAAFKSGRFPATTLIIRMSSMWTAKSTA